MSFRKKLTILSILFLLPALPVRARPVELICPAPAFTCEQQQSLVEKVASLVQSAEGKVGYVFIDPGTGLSVQYNGATPFPAASVAKVPIMAAAFNLNKEGALDLFEKVNFKDSDKVGGSGVLQWMRAGQDYTIWNLVRLMIVLSDNTATRLVVDTIGQSEINAYLLREGLTETRITDHTMLAEPPAGEVNMTTPQDMARLLLKIKDRSGFTEKGVREMLSFMKNQRYRWGIWRGVPPRTKVADKTGNLDEVYNDAGIVYTPKGDFILSIFTWGFKKPKDARLMINRLTKITYEEYTGEKVVFPKTKPSRKRLRGITRLILMPR